jgi:uncharacterized membrane protein (DUF2068 family)
MKRDAGVSAIIAYKMVKAVLEALLGLLALYMVIRGAEAGAATLAEILIEHFSGDWAIALAKLIVRGGTSGHVEFVALFAFGDAVLSAVEGLSLRAQKWWAPWLVVIATGSLLPWEVWELVLHPRWVRLVLFIINVAVVVYLLRGVAREHRQSRPVDALPGRP